MNKILLVLTVAFALFFPGCRIWEDRQGCPSYLEVDCSLFEGKALSADIWLFSSEGQLVQRLRITEHEFYQPQRFSVPKGDYKCFVWANVGENTIVSDANTLGGAFYKKSGSSADQLYSFSTEKTCYQEVEYIKAIPKKMFIDVYVTVKGLQAGDCVDLELRSDWGGRTLSGEGVRQEAVVDATTSDWTLMRVLRPQTLENLFITAFFRFEGGTSLASGFNLGAFLQMNNYDISSADLKDVHLTIDVNKLKAGIGVDPFEVVPPVVISF